LGIIVTDHHKHAYEVVKKMSLDVDCLIPVSGDGLIHECINGLADHPGGKDALRIPVAPVPAGSGNGLSISLLGSEVVSDLSLLGI